VVHGYGKMKIVGSKMPSATPFYMVRSTWVRNHGLVAPPDRGVNLTDLIW
jgi:hypothetical protein